MLQTKGKRSVAMRLTTLAIAMVVLYAGTPHTQQQAPPIKLGTSGSNVNDIADYCCTGTLGAQMKDANGKYILSNNHVLARANAGVPGEAIMQRGYVDTTPVCTNTGTITVAHLTRFVTLNFTGGNNTADAAIAQVVTGQVNANGQILQLGVPAVAPAVAAVGMAVEKSGRTTGLTTGTIGAVNVTVNVTGYGICGCGQPGEPACQTAKFVKQFSISSATFSGGGDSGSLIVKVPATGARPNPVGLLFAGGTGITFANTIQAVMNQLAVTFDASAPTAAELAAAAEVRDPEVEAASRVKDRYDDYLMTLPEVVGHGVSKDASGRGVIQLYMRKASQSARRAAPETLEGIPVVIRETGEVRTIPGCVSRH